MFAQTHVLNGEWLQRLSLVRRWHGKPFTMGWRWPRWLNGGWPQTVLFLAVALVYMAVVYGPWDWLRAWAGNTVVVGPVAYLGILIGVSLLAVPGLLWVASYWFTRLSGTKGLSVSRVWASMGYALVPMGLAAWMAFALSPLSEGVAYLPSLLSDPVGRGWDLFGTAHAKWPPLFGAVLPYSQAGGILVGLVASLWVLHRRLVDLPPRHTRGLWLGLFPAMILLAGIAVALLWLFMG